MLSDALCAHDEWEEMWKLGRPDLQSERSLKRMGLMLSARVSRITMREVKASLTQSKM